MERREKGQPLGNERIVYRTLMGVWGGTTVFELLQLAREDDGRSWAQDCSEMDNLHVIAQRQYGLLDEFCTEREFIKQRIREHKTNVAIRRILERLGNESLIIISAYQDFEYGGMQESRHSATVEEILREVMEQGRWAPKPWELLSSVKTIQQLGNQYEGMQDDPLCFFGTEKAWEEWKAEKERAELELAASEIAHTEGVKVNSIEFIEAVQKRIGRISQESEDWNNPEVRAEEWAAHMYCGTRDAYFDDLNYVNGKFESSINEYERILNWLSQNCPLLWAKYEESQLEEKAS